MCCKTVVLTFTVTRVCCGHILCVSTKHFLVLGAGFSAGISNLVIRVHPPTRVITSMKMESLLAAQQEFHGRIGRTLKNLKKTGSAKITRPLIATTIRLLDSKWAKFEEQHDRLRNKHWEEVKTHEYYLSDLLGQTEGIYVQQRAALLDWEGSLKVIKEDARSTLSDTPPPPRTTLPRIQPPHFSGKYEDWPPFRNLFRSLIVNDPVISDVHYLKASLKGEAELLVRSLSTTEENFPRAWQVLIDYYENTCLLVLEANTRDGCAVFGYADDIIIVTTGSSIRHVVEKADRRIRSCLYHMRVLGVKVAPDKTDAVLF